MAYLCGVIDKLQGRVTGHHGSNIRKGTQAVEPAFSGIWFRALENLYHWKRRRKRKTSFI